ncbi:MAG: phosphoglycerate mutase [Acidimicrobiales bacterium]|nr:MAG: phosphoglycerate mutase [Acidimicrobiales bacterium]
MPSRKPKAAPPTLVLYVRHGTTPTTGRILPGRAPGLDLAEDGRVQARSVGEKLAALAKVDVVYASPLARARQTAALIAEQLGQEVHTEKGLLECDFGEWTGAELKELMKRPEWQTVQRWPSGWRFPGGESFAEMQARMSGACESFRVGHPGGTVVAVSHADPIKAAVAEAMGLHLDLFQRVVIAPCSVTAITYSATGPAVLAVNALATELKLQ